MTRTLPASATSPAVPAPPRTGRPAGNLARGRRLTVRPARARHELQAFAAGYRAASGYAVAASQLARGRAFVALRRGRIVGGFVLNAEPPFRTVIRLPETEQHRLAHEFPPGRTVELTCVWLAKEARGGLSSAQLWAALVWHGSRQRRDTVVFGTEVDRLRRFYERTGPRLLYEGDVRVDGRLRHGWVYSISRRRWPYALLRLLTSRRRS